MSQLEPRAWTCTTCGYVHYGPQPPDECPVCGSESDLFEPYDEPEVVRAEPAAPVAAAHLRVVVAGAGIAGVSAAEAIRKGAPGAEILLLSGENCLPYYRLKLTRYLAGELGAEALPLQPQGWYADQGIDLRLGAELREIQAAGGQVVLSDGSRRPFDRLVLAAGANAWVPPIPGADRQGVTVLRTIDEADRILEAAQPGSRWVCIGGGILGLETAGALARRGAEVTLVEGMSWLLPRQLNERAGRLLEAYVASMGIAMRLNVQTQEIAGDARACATGAGERARSVRLAGGTTLPADGVIVTTGVRSNAGLARQAGLEVKQGVVVDDLLRTSHPHVYAAGDIAEHRGIVYGLWGPAQFQGTIAGMNVAGGMVEFAGIPRSNTLKVLGYDMYSIGQIRLEDAPGLPPVPADRPGRAGSFRQVEEERDGRYRYFVFRDTYLVGAILLGDVSSSPAVKKAVEKGLDCAAVLRGQPTAGAVVEFLQEAAL